MPAITPRREKSSPGPALLIPPERLARPWHRLLMRALAAAAAFLFAVFFQWRVEGQENVPARGPAFVTVNHLSAIDIPALGAALIRLGWEPGVNMFTVAKQEVFRNPILARVLPLFGMFPLNRNQLDLSAMRTLLAILERGALVGVAPEGTRSPTGHLQLFQPGLAKIIIQKRVPILPAGLAGMERAMPIGTHIPRPVPIRVRFGPLYELASYYDLELTPEVLERAAWEMRAHVAELLPEWMRELPPAGSEVRFGGVGSDAAAPAPQEQGRA